MAIITSPENMKKLERYKDISGRLAHAEGVTEQEAHALAQEGKAVVWIDGGLHATETVGSQQLMEMVYQMVQPHRRRDDAVPQRRDHAQRARRIPTARSWSRTGTCARRIRSSAAMHGAAAAVCEVRRSRRQPRFLHVEHEGNHEHEPPVVHRVVPADHVQPSPDRARPAR